MRPRHKDLRELPPGYWAATILALRYSIPLPSSRDSECCLTSAISGGAQSARRLLIGTYPRRGLSLQAACRRATTAASHS
jgi:hypothetical protein